MGDPLVFMHEGDRDLPFVIFSWGLALAMAGDYDSFTNLTDMLLDGG